MIHILQLFIFPYCLFLLKILVMLSHNSISIGTSKENVLVTITLKKQYVIINLQIMGRTTVHSNAIQKVKAKP